MPDGVLVKSGKTVEDALAAALAELGVTKDMVEYTVLDEPGKKFFGLLGSRPARVRVSLKETAEEPEETDGGAGDVSDISSAAQTPDESSQGGGNGGERGAVDEAESFLREVLRSMDIKVDISRRENGDTVVFNLTGERLGVLIGKHGQTLDALQYLVNLAVGREEEGRRIKVIVDVENYRRRREETLRNLALRLADRARYLNEEVKLEPMNRYDRKIIHMTLASDRRVTTYSDGDDPYRRVIISPRRKNRNGDGYRRERDRD